jgi:hypothetical protein
MSAYDPKETRGYTKGKSIEAGRTVLWIKTVGSMYGRMASLVA